MNNDTVRRYVMAEMKTLIKKAIICSGKIMHIGGYVSFKTIYIGIAAKNGGIISFSGYVMPNVLKSINPSATVMNAKDIIELIIAPSIFKRGIFTNMMFPRSFNKIPASCILKGS